MKPAERMLIDMARFYGFDLDKRRLDLYVQVLEQFPIEAVLQCGREYMQDPRNDRFPVPPHKILARHLPQSADSKDVGRETALRIREAVSKFGWPSPAKAKEHIGELGWSVVERMGGWSHICENLGVEIPESVFLAQARDAAESMHRLGGMGYDSSAPALEQRIKPSQELTLVKDIITAALPQKEE